jgi:hypothetical protein
VGGGPVGKKPELLLFDPILHPRRQYLRVERVGK